jgi:hypothetical protein
MWVKSKNKHFNISTPKRIQKDSGNTLSFLVILKILLNQIIMLTKMSLF